MQRAEGRERSIAAVQIRSIGHRSVGAAFSFDLNDSINTDSDGIRLIERRQSPQSSHSTLFMHRWCANQLVVWSTVPIWYKRIHKPILDFSPPLSLSPSLYLSPSPSPSLFGPFCLALCLLLSLSFFLSLSLSITDSVSVFSTCLPICLSLSGIWLYRCHWHMSTPSNGTDRTESLSSSSSSRSSSFTSEIWCDH